jgi:GTP cyclohydrolase I
VNEHKIIGGVQLILEGLGVDLKDRNYIKTPWRVLELYRELFNKKFTFPPVYEERYDEMIIMRHHQTWTLCPHHLLPVHLDISVAYVPNGGVVGLSKLCRIAESVLNKPAMQESITHDIADALMKNINPTPLGAGCIVRGEHLCMRMRGVKTSGSVVTSAMRGVLLQKPEARAEFLALAEV